MLSMAIAVSAAGSIASVTAGRAQAGQDSSKVSDSDPLAVALGYVSDATQADAKANPARQPGAKCANCSWYAPTPGAAAGLCNYFPGKLVDSKAWCRMWAGHIK